ncbi:MAG: transposase [Elusimicrobia bacterium]|nr:transposase [Elusimicrobiota bacterium]
MNATASLDADREQFLSRLKLCMAGTGIKCLAWCLMSNHFHLLVLRGERPLSELMRRLMTGYVSYFNRRRFGKEPWRDF